ncbi:MAG TPA: TlpA disulfide reductase family protein [Solirubrobacterales bacterium]|nr:TlpA disulfide reductase family protein [Solirubrobacterales bacterium]
MKKRHAPSIALAGLVLLALVAAGCGSGSNQDYGGAHPDYAKALAGSPPQLAALHKQANRLLPGGNEAFQARVASLRGYPVVANLWASWCNPCRAEFPTLQKLSARYGKEVAFLGVNSEDSDDAAATFLEEAPLSYPSYTDPHGEVGEALHSRGGYPDTAFYSRSGELCYLKQGQYAEQSELEADVRLYALGNGCESG